MLVRSVGNLFARFTCWVLVHTCAALGGRCCLRRCGGGGMFARLTAGVLGACRRSFGALVQLEVLNGLSCCANRPALRYLVYYAISVWSVWAWVSHSTPG